ncbi:MAG: geranylgeranyl reductase family protein [Sphingobacteriia bacterium]|nr:geranylgeranyl reductase family protein [Sphingobacteriia bacterium]NCC41057.1 geranylgeranyl reductase family protein [Gammaproteobacteria bacterium]
MIMPDRHHTAIVVGGGPAGSAAAYTLAQQGVDVALIDKAVFPREKLCGGLLTRRSQTIFTEVFQADWVHAHEYRAHGVRIFAGTRLLTQVEDYSELFFTHRRDFDDHLLGLARSRGAVTRLGDGLVSLDPAARVCRLRSGATLTYEYLIAADGVNSLVARAIQGRAFDPARVAFALELELERTPSDRDVTLPEIHFGVVDWGYGWVFPKRETLTVGIGGLQLKNPALKARFANFLAARFGDRPLGRIKGHHIPFGEYRKTLGAGSVLLVGDAAGFVEPITGEGIAFAMQSGHLAALAILDALRAGDPGLALRAYHARSRPITKVLDHANRLRYLIFPKTAEALLVKALPLTSSLPRRHLDLMADAISYDDYTRHLLRTALRWGARRALARVRGGHGGP